MLTKDMAVLPWLLLSVTITMVRSECSRLDSQCVFYLNIEHKLTMMRKKELFFPANGNLYKYDVTNTSAAEPSIDRDVISADGWETPRLIIVANSTMPGPDIIVYQGQKVIVHVKNGLRSESTTIHWHGMHMRNTPYMDGVPFVTQCPIHPGQSFKYEFKADQRGTFWWHAHSGTQHTMGLYGALIIKDNTFNDRPVEEHIMQIQDWNHDFVPEHIMLTVPHGIYEDRKKWAGARSLDDSEFTMFKFHSGLINGKGRYYSSTKGSNYAPLTVFNVTYGRKYIFRVIGTGNVYPFRVSVDNHTLTVIASDGYDIEPIIAESFIIYPGERYDFEIMADKPVANYWIRGITLEKGTNHRADAILRYVGAPDEDPVSSRMQCSQQDPCIVLSCPFTYYPTNFTICKTLNDLKALTTDDPAPSYKKDSFKELFLNFVNPPSVNGRKFDIPDVNLLTQPTEWNSPCDSSQCIEGEICKCTYAPQIGNGDTIQMVWTGLGSGNGVTHVIHMHGHSFYVLKMGFGHYDIEMAKIVADNSDIDCPSIPGVEKTFCRNAKWSNTSWVNGNVPGLELERPPRKDTIIVPSGGYVVLRIRANNPGIWNVHCHFEIHHLSGMQFLLNESFSEIPSMPVDFPECHSFPPNRPRLMVNAAFGNSTSPDNKIASDESDDVIKSPLFWSVIGTLGGFVVLQILILIVCGYLSRRRQTMPEKYGGSAVNEAFRN